MDPSTAGCSGAVACDLCTSTSQIFFAASPDGDYVRCSSCGLIYGVASSEGLAFRYDERYNDPGSKKLDRHNRQWLRKAERRLESLEQHRRTGWLLEVGCNRGDFLDLARRTGQWKPIGVELSGALASFARTDRGLDVREGTIETVAPTLRVGEFDVVWAANLLEHVISPTRFLNTVQELLRPGGVFVGSTLNGDSWSLRVSGPQWQYLHSAVVHRFVFNLTTLQRYCSNSGLHIVAVSTSGFRFRSKYMGGQWFSPLVRGAEQLCANAARLAHKGHRIEIWARKPSDVECEVP